MQNHPLLALRQAFEALYKARLVAMVLYGSQARGDMTTESDADVLVVLTGRVDPGEEIHRTGSLVADLSLQHNMVISCLFMSSERYSQEQSPLLINVRREGVSI